MKTLRILLVLAAILSLTACRGGDRDLTPSPTPTTSPTGTVSEKPSEAPTPTEKPTPDPANLAPFVTVPMTADTAARKLKIAAVKPEVLLQVNENDKDQIKATFDLTVEQRKNFPDFAMMKLWLIEDSKGTNKDEKYGKTFISLMTKENTEANVFAQAVGIMIPTPETKDQATKTFQYLGKLPYNIRPYDRVMITLESDGNREEHNPRPGTPMWTGKINWNGKTVQSEKLPSKRVIIVQDLEKEGFESTDITKELNIPELSFSRIEISRMVGQAWLRIGFKDKPELPQNSYFEGWIVDNFTNEPHNQKYGPSFNSAAIAARLKNSPQPLSLGELKFTEVDAAGNYIYETVLDARAPLTGFDSIHVTIESENSEKATDPRPGPRLYYGKL